MMLRSHGVFGRLRVAYRRARCGAAHSERGAGLIETALLLPLLVLLLVGYEDDERGASLVETAVLLPLLVLLLVGCVDYGRGFYTAIEVASAAEAGALYGTLSPTDTAGMAAMAKLDAADVSGLNAVATYGCECADGSSFSANCATPLSCSTNIVKYVQVVTSASYTPMLPYPGIPAAIPLQNKVRLRAMN